MWNPMILEICMEIVSCCPLVAVDVSAVFFLEWLGGRCENTPESASKVNTTYSSLIGKDCWGKQMMGKETGSHSHKKRNRSVRKSHPGKDVASKDAIDPNGMGRITQNCLLVCMAGLYRLADLILCSIYLDYFSSVLTLW